MSAASSMPYSRRMPMDKMPADLKRLVRESNAERTEHARAFGKVTDAARTLYFVDGKPSLRESSVAFLDLLGTTKRMPDLTDDDLGKLIRSLRRPREWIGDAAEMDWPHQLISFSDNVAIGTPFYGEWYDRGLMTQVFAIAGIQLNLVAVDHVLLRGGIVQGPLYMDEGIVLGQALVDAYELEQQTKYPRVEVAKDIVPLLLLESLKWADPLESTLEATLLVDDVDEAVFVHYLQLLLEEPTIKDLRRGLQAHRLALRGGLETHPTGEVRRKYEWAAEYHNWFCGLLGQNRYRIDDSKGQLNERTFLGLIAHYDAHVPDWKKTVRDAAGP